LQNGKPLRGKGLQAIPAGERLVLETPGGAGYGNPKHRDAALLRQEVDLGLVSADAVSTDYGFAAGEGPGAAKRDSD
jgi:N-methylhydantoinase B